jgi:hypothetical protein
MLDPPAKLRPQMGLLPQLQQRCIKLDNSHKLVGRSIIFRTAEYILNSRIFFSNCDIGIVRVIKEQVNFRKSNAQMVTLGMRNGISAESNTNDIQSSYRILVPVSELY